MGIASRWIVIMVLGLGVVPVLAHADAPKKKYNVLLIFSDDQRRDTIAALGNPHIQTPNLDKLVRSGTFFRNAHIMGALQGAVCMPSRAMMLSGRTLWRAPTNLEGVTTLGEVLRRAGYLTFGTGKWHNGPASFERTFELGHAVFFGGMCDHWNVPANRLTRSRKFEKYRAKGKHSSELFADAAVDFLKNEVNQGDNADKPFFLYVAFTASHDPRDAPKKYREMYYKKKPPLPANFLPQHPFNNGDMTGRDEMLAAWPRTEAVIRDQLAEYYALISHMDEQIARILQALRDSGEYENTIIIFAADNGLALGSHGLLGKQNLYEHSTGVPLLLAGPGIPQHKHNDALVYLFDIFPTVCDLNGVAIPKGVEGKSLAGLLQGNEKSVRDSLYTVYRDVQRGCRDDRWALICYPKVNRTQLFDLQNDPHQLKNLAGQPEQVQRIEQMKARLLAWEKQLGAPQQPLTSTNPQPAEINLSGRQRRPDQWQPAWIRQKYFAE